MQYVYILSSYGYEHSDIIKAFESLDDAKDHIPGLTWVEHQGFLFVNSWFQAEFQAK